MQYSIYFELIYINNEFCSDLDSNRVEHDRMTNEKKNL